MKEALKLKIVSIFIALYLILFAITTILTKNLEFFFYIIIIGIFIGIPLLLILIKASVERRLNLGFQYRNIFIKTRNLKIPWNLNLYSDSCFIALPEYQVSINALSIKINPFSPSFFRSPFMCLIAFLKTRR